MSESDRGRRHVRTVEAEKTGVQEGQEKSPDGGLGELHFKILRSA